MAALQPNWERWRFSLETFGKETLVYSESGRKMTVTIDRDSGGVTVYTDSVARWDADLGQPIDTDTTKRIINNIQRGFESQGEFVAVF